MGSLAQLLRDGLRLAVLGRPRSVPLATGFGGYALFFLAGVAIDIAWQWPLVEAPRRFETWGLQSALAAGWIRLACVALHDAAGATYRLLVDPAILNAAPMIQAPDSAADTRAIVARNAVLASALQSITIGVALCDATAPEATILYVNPAFGRITGYEPQEVIGQPLRFLQGRGTPQDQVERLERALIQRRAANLLLRSQR